MAIPILGLLIGKENGTELGSVVRTQINNLYNPSISPQVRGALKKKRMGELASVADLFGNVDLVSVQQMGVNNRATQWTVNLFLDRFALPSTFTIDVFIGEVPTTNWGTAGNLIGSHSQFIMADAVASQQSFAVNGTVRGQISITHALAAGVDRGVLQDLSPESVLPLLRQELRWGIREAPDIYIQSLQVVIGSQNILPRVSLCEFPVYQDMVLYTDVGAWSTTGVVQWTRAN